MFIFSQRAHKYSNRLLISSLMLLVFTHFSQLHAADSDIGISDIKVLVLYTKGVSSRYDGSESTRINHLFNVSNKAFLDSDIHATLTVVHSKEIDYTDDSTAISAVEALEVGSGVFSDVNTLRATYGADIVVLYRPYKFIHGNCGLAYVGGYKNNGDMTGYANLAYAHVGIDSCPDSTTVHEIGHNLGALHSRKQDLSGGGTFNYALGYGVSGKFVDVMAYPSEFNVTSNSILNKFSNPMLDCMGEPCGVERGQPDSADASFAINITAPQVANYYGDSDAALVSTRKAIYIRIVQVNRDLLDAKSLASVQQEKVNEAEMAVIEYSKALDKLTTSTAASSSSYQDIQTKLATQLENLESATLSYNAKNELGQSNTSFWLKIVAKREASIIYDSVLKFANTVQAARSELANAKNNINTSTNSIRLANNRLNTAEASLQIERDKLAPLVGTVSWLQNSYDALSTEYTNAGGRSSLPSN